MASRWRVAVLTNLPDVAGLAVAAVARLGLEPVAVVSARRRAPAPGRPNVDESTTVAGTEVRVAQDKDSLAPLLCSLRPDLVISWAFPWRLSSDALGVPSRGAINYHPSLLPRHRGPNPLAWTVRNGDGAYGVTWHRMDPAYDSGPILAQRSSPAGPEDTASEVVLRVSTLAIRSLRGVIEQVGAGDPGRPQPAEGVTEAPPFGEDYATIDWSQPRRSVHDQVRAWALATGSASVDGPFGEVGGRRVRVLRTTLNAPSAGGWRVDCGDGPIWILDAEPA